MKLQSYLKSLIFVFSLATITHTIQPTTRLSQFHFGAASVLPTYKNTQGQTMVVLAKEAGGRDKGTYDDFGGQRDAGERHPEITAARECLEELILEKTAGKTLRSLRKHINTDSGNTSYIIARKSKKSVVYITDFSQEWSSIRKTFYSARHNAKQYKYREKDHLVVVPWTKLQDAISTSKPGQTVTMCAYGINRNGTRNKNTINITLRPFFVAKLRPFFQNQPFEKGLNKKIRFYQ